MLQNTLYIMDLDRLSVVTEGDFPISRFIVWDQ